MGRLIGAVLVFILSFGSASAQVCGTLSSCPFASTPFGGSELVYLVQNGTSTKTTLGSLASYFGSGGSGAVNSVSNSDATLVIAPTTGSVVASLNLAHSNIWAVPQTFSGGLTGTLTGSASLNLLLTGGTLSGNLAVPGFTISGISGSVQCIQANSFGVLSGAGTACGGSAGTITVGTTPISGGTSQGLLFNNGTLGNTNVVNNAIVVTNGSGAPSESTTTPSGLTIPSPTFTGTVAGAGTVPNAVLANFTISGVALGNSLATLTFGTHVSGASYNGSSAVTIATDATSASTVSTIVSRDSSGNFSAGTITASLTGLASLNLPLSGGTMSGAILFSAGAATTRGPTGLNIDDLCTFGDANYTAASTCRQVQTTTVFTAPRTLTLPAAASVNAGQRLAFKDAAGAVGTTNTLTIARAGSDLIDGATSASLNTAYAGADLDSDGSSKWTYTAGTGGGGSVSSIAAGPGLSANSGAFGGTITSSGTLQLLDQTRRNSLINQMNMAKALGTCQRSIDQSADGFADATCINASASSGYSLSTISKTVTNQPQSQSNTASSTVNNTGYTNLARSVQLTPGATLTQIGFNTATAQTLDLKIGLLNSTSNVTIVYSQSVSHAGGGLQLFTLTTPYSVPATGAYYIGAYTNATMATTGASGLTLYISGDATGTSASWNQNTSNNEPVVSTVYGTSSAMTLQENYQTADATLVGGRATVILQSGLSPVWAPNASATDELDITCNGGTNWTSVAAVSGGVVQAGSNQSGGTIYEIPDTTCPGTPTTSFAARYKVLSATARTVYATSSTVH